MASGLGVPGGCGLLFCEKEGRDCTSALTTGAYMKSQSETGTPCRSLTPHSCRFSLSSGYHHQSNGQTERTNQSLENMLQCLAAHRPAAWSTFLPGVGSYPSSWRPWVISRPCSSPRRERSPCHRFESSTALQGSLETGTCGSSSLFLPDAEAVESMLDPCTCLQPGPESLTIREGPSAAGGVKEFGYVLCRPV